jgi:hypothetical protein
VRRKIKGMTTIPGNSRATALPYSVIQINKYISNMDV